MSKEQKKITVRAMILNYHYHCVFHHDLDVIKNHNQFSQWWHEMDNFNRTYVLKGNYRKS